MEAGLSRTVSGVPGYAWRHGCGPTAVGMILGYYDTHGFPVLFPGDGETQTNEVDQGIASQGSGVRGYGLQLHYEDYSLPNDSEQSQVLADSSVNYPSGCHTDNSVADFMHTSWSKDGNLYGWSWSNRIMPSFTSYATLKSPYYIPHTAEHYMGSSLTWALLTNEINHSRPMVFLVDSSGDGKTDHFVTVVAYSDDPTPQYGCLDTWYPYDQIRWCDFRPMSSSYAWGVWGGWSFGLSARQCLGDFEGESKANLAVFRPSTGAWYVLSSAATGSFTSSQWGVPGDLVVHADYDGDRKADVAVWRPSAGIWYILPSNSPGTIFSTQWGMPTDIPVPGDYDGDGKDDVAVWRPGSGVWYVLPSASPGTYTTKKWGIAGDIAVPRDYDGDGRIDVSVWRPGTGVWYILPSGAPSTFTSTQWGVSTDKPVPADYDGDGKTDIAVWRPSAGVWYILRSGAPGAYTSTQWGVSTDTPAAGDFDGDGKAEITVYRPSRGIWYTVSSAGSGTYTAKQWGLPTDVPISALTAILRQVP